MSVEALTSRLNVSHEEKRLKTAADDVCLVSVLVRVCLDHLHVRDLAHAACVSRTFRGQALLCNARPLADISYGEIVHAQLSLDRHEGGPWLALVARNGLSLEFCPDKVFQWRHFSNIPITAVRQNGLALQFVGKMGNDCGQKDRLKVYATRQNAAAASISID